jgi:O-antigen/teichoic acid export membrane protein
LQKRNDLRSFFTKMEPEQTFNFTQEELKNKKRFLGNTTVQLAGTAINFVTGLTITSLLARYLGAKGFGELSLALIYFSFAGIIANLGFSVIIVREISKIKEWDHKEISAMISSGLILRILSTIFGIFGLALYIYTRDYPLLFKGQVLLMSLVHFIIAFNVFDTVFRTKLRMEYSVYASIIYRIAHLVMILLCVFFNGSLTFVILTYTAANAINIGLIILFSGKLLKFQLIWDRAKISYLLMETLPLGLAGGLWIIYYRVDSLMLDWLKGVETIAMYNAAFRFVDYAFMLSSLFMVSLYPLMSGRYPDNLPGLNRIYQKSFNYLAIIGGFISFVLMMAAPLLVKVIFGKEYMPAAAALRIFGFIPLLLFLNNACGHMLLVLGMQGKPLLTMRSFGVFVNLGLNLLLIPCYSFCGAAIATVITESVLLIIVLILIKRKIGFLPSLRNPAVLFAFLLLFFIVLIFCDLNPS